MKIGSETVIIRDARLEDRPWVCSCWIDSMFERHGTAMHPKTGYTRRQLHAMVNGLYLTAALSVKVAELEGEPPVLVGFIAVIDDETMWMYVTRQFEGHGIGKALKESVS